MATPSRTNGGNNKGTGVNRRAGLWPVQTEKVELARLDMRAAPNQLDWNRCAQVIQHGTAPIDGPFQSFDVHVRGGTVHSDDTGDVLETGARRLLHAEEAAQILKSVQLDRDEIQRNAERIRIQAPRDFLTGSERRKQHFARL